MKTISNIYFKGATKFIFVSTTKIGENTTNISKLLFFTINLHFVTSNQITTFRKLNLPPSSSIYFVFFTSINAKKTQKDQSMPRVFLLCLKRNDPQRQLQTFFSPVRMLLVQLASINVFHSL